jgi:hypothetical protein
MNQNPLKDGVLTDNSAGIGAVTRKMVLGRAEELALISGNWLHQVSTSDLAQARRELAGEPGADPKTALLETAPESERWDPVPGSTGHKTRAAGSEDEDDEGRSDNERLVEEGVAQAEHDKMVHAARAAERSERRED